MPDWEPTLPHTWLLRGLPDAEAGGKVYSFTIGHLDYIIPEGKQAVYLTIPEIPNRDAEGRPKYPEQEAWVNKTLVERRIQARDIWWSHWQFASREDAIAFEKLLQKFGATTERLEQPSSTSQTGVET